VESGGAVREVGHYVLFCDENGRAIPWLQPLQSIGANGLHAVVIAPEREFSASLHESCGA
jgi:hypothetical protein